MFFHIFLPYTGVFFISIFTDKTEVYFEEDVIVIFDKKELTTINHNQIKDIISDATSVEIFYDNTSIKLKSTTSTRSSDFSEVLSNLNKIKSSKISKYDKNQKIFITKAIIFTNLLYYRN